MGIGVHMDMRQIREHLNREAQKNIHRVVALLQYVGETTINEIRQSHISDWIDQTGNLRSSIGYIIALDGKPVTMSDFRQVDGPKRGTKEDPGFSSDESKSYAQELAELYPHGIALIVVAGMEYASYVEKRENKVVLAQGEIEAKKLVEQLIWDLNNKLRTGK